MRPSGAGAVRGSCLRCGAPVLRQLVGRRAALSVVADAEPMTAADAFALREPNRLDWCLRELSTGPDLRWTARSPSPCPHPHVIDHRCPAGTPAGRQPEGALW
ncbi:hypothetical protein I5Q34_34140 [Streptomyces sp. AV19]|uniref:hypothetical protein n=1 Tax=Streptomyces sp. AV19 TaxID=2793068 RepID=UPI0018FED990|nr:hypothetical protein [Streptomyces sp. AV19]MBH1939242.1 hypothetical protein [Streptomyces sp. AV19]MDG4531659.1 hypothetical protein [Streptomyces sp. AV19]